jgi:Fe-S-cluster containining protein
MARINEACGYNSAVFAGVQNKRKKSMNLFGPARSIRHVSDRFAPFAEKLQAVFAAMDSAYAAVAEKYRFHCAGCEDNCCRTRFYHHTLLELFYLHRGWSALESQQRAAVRSRAKDVCRQMTVQPPGGGASRSMCPLNHSGRCELYEYRPMICRLHGIPHVLLRPDGAKTAGPGCDAFERQCGSRSDAVLDRTPHYQALAALEQELRRAMEFSYRPKLTVAEMIVQFDPE